MNPDIDILEPNQRPSWTSRPGPTTIGYKYRVVLGRELKPDTEFTILPKSSLMEIAGLCAALNHACLSSEIMELMEFRTAENWRIETPAHQLNYVIVRITKIYSHTH